MPGHPDESNYEKSIHDVVGRFGKRIAMALSDGNIKIIGVLNGSELRELAILKGHNVSVSVIAWAPPSRGSLLASCCVNGLLTVWQEDEQNVWIPAYVYCGHKSKVQSASWTSPPFEIYLACGYCDGSIAVSSTKTDGKWETVIIDQAHSNEVLMVSWEPSCGWDGCPKLLSRCIDTTEKLWALDNGVWKMVGDETAAADLKNSGWIGSPNHLHEHRHHRRPHRLSVPSRPFSLPYSDSSVTPQSNVLSSRIYPQPSCSAATPTPTPSKLHTPSFVFPSASYSSKGSFSFFLLLLLSLRSLFSLFPFIKSSPPSSLLPFTFLVSLFSFLLSLSLSFHSEKSYYKSSRPRLQIFSISSLSQSQHKLCLAKSAILSLVLLLRFKALSYCGAAALILAELSGSIAIRYLFNRSSTSSSSTRGMINGYVTLLMGLFLLSSGWDQLNCFPLSFTSMKKFELHLVPQKHCFRIWPVFLAFICGVLGSFERHYTNWNSIAQLGEKRVRLITQFYVSVLLFVPAIVSFAMSTLTEETVSLESLSWPLANTVVFGVLFTENHRNETSQSLMEFQREFLVTFFCTVVLELIYFPYLSLWGLMFCGSLLYFSMRELDPLSFGFLKSGAESSMEPLKSMVVKPVLHILREKKSRKIAIFLLINTAYMVIEFAAGFMSNSLGLISDACHMLFDCAALAIGLYASYISRLPANNHFNYGRGRFEVLTGYVNAIFLVLVAALIVLESFERILDPQQVSTSSLLIVSIGGLAVNLIGLLFFHDEHHHAHGGSCSHHKDHRHRHHDHHHRHHDHHHHHHHDHHHHIDHNMEGIFLHVLADTMGSIGVVISTLLIKYKGWLVADPVCSIFISSLIVLSVIPLLRNSAEILLQRMPRSLEQNIREAISGVTKSDGVLRIRKLHVWSFTNTDIVGTLSVCLSPKLDSSTTRISVLDKLERAGIKDLTIQVEYAPN